MTGLLWLDSLAVGASTLCLVYCLILPVVLVLVLALAVLLAIPERFHLGVFLVAIPSSAVALTMGYGRHRRRMPMLLAAAGLACLAAGLFTTPSEQAETLLTIVGSCLNAFGLVQDWRGMRHRHRWSGR